MTLNGLRTFVNTRPTQVPWLSSLPLHWNECNIKRLFRQTKRLGFPKRDVLSVYREYGVVLKASRDDNNNNKTPEDVSVYQRVDVGDLVINKMKSWQGSLGVSNYDGITSPDYIVYCPLHAENSRFIHYLLRAEPMPAVYRSISNGIRPSQWRLEPGKFELLTIPLPPVEEQTQIARFLDYETARIDALIDKQQQLIALLKEKRQAVISHAVTKGLNPDAPMRDSGIEWIGQVPAHWSVLPVRYAVRVDNGARLPINRENRAKMGGPYPYWGPTRILDYIDQYRYEGERAIIGEDGDHFLKFATWPMTQWATGKFNVNNHAHVVASGPHCSARWFYYAFLHRDIGADVITQGVSRLKLSREGLSKLVFAVPPVDEQAAIIDRVEEMVQKVTRAEALAEQQCTLLKERRSALISAAVTGKIDVRGWDSPTASEVTS